MAPVGTLTVRKRLSSTKPIALVFRSQLGKAPAGLSVTLGDVDGRQEAIPARAKPITPSGTEDRCDELP